MYGVHTFGCHVSKHCFFFLFWKHKFYIEASHNRYILYLFRNKNAKEGTNVIKYQMHEAWKLSSLYKIYVREKERERKRERQRERERKREREKERRKKQ